MEMYSDDAEIKLIWVVVNFGEGSRVLKYAREIGISGGTIFFGRGTDTNKVAEFLGLGTVRKEILLMGAGPESSKTALADLDKKFEFAKPRHGIAFSKKITSFLGSRDHIYNRETESEDEKVDYHAITVIVNKGKGELAVEAAKAAGATGGTIINARGAGTHETSKMFSIEIEPEKEVVIIVSKSDATDKIYESIRAKLELDEPGTGVMFKEKVDGACGID